MTVLEPRQAYTLLAEDYDSTPNALIALEERMMAPLLLRDSPRWRSSETRPTEFPAGQEPDSPPWRRLPACVGRSETCPTEFPVSKEPDSPPWRRLPACVGRSETCPTEFPVSQEPEPPEWRRLPACVVRWETCPTEFPAGRTVEPALCGVSTNLAECTVVDVAAGTGRWALHCAKQGARAIAVDFCLEMLRTAPRPAVQADARRLPFVDASADIVICSFALGYAPECFTELARITRPGGMLLVSDVHPDAVARGWTRSFRHRGDVIRVMDQPYEVADLHAPDLRLSSFLEPRLGLPERDIFERAGRLDLFDEACLEPAIFVARFSRD